MSIASLPLAFATHAHQKRGRSYFDENNDPEISLVGQYSSSKRRRHDKMDEDSTCASPEHTSISSSSLPQHTVSVRTPLIAKRQRFDSKGAFHSSWAPVSQTPQIHQEVNRLQAILTKQKSELDQTKSEKEGIQKEAQKMSVHLEKATHENRILKRAVAIQQERQTLAAAENENLKKLNMQAGEHIQRCEREILMLRAHVGVQNAPAGFMGFGPRPPDVY